MRVDIRVVMMPVGVLAISGVFLLDHHPRQAVAAARPATVDGVALGRAYAPVLLAGYADAWLAAATALEDGKTVEQAQSRFQDAWKDARLRSFRQHVLPGFSAVLSEGTEPVDPSKRAEVAAFWRSFARGLKQGKGVDLRPGRAQEHRESTNRP